QGAAVVDIGAYEVVFVDYGDAPDSVTGAGTTETVIETGNDDFRVSIMGSDAETNASLRTQFTGIETDIAYNQTDNEFLVVWRGDDDTAPLVNNEWEVYGVRYDADTETKIGSQFRISFMGNDLEMASTNRDNFFAAQPSVAWNSGNNEYLVTWYGDHDVAPLTDNDFEIFGQRLSNTGGLAGSMIRISQMGPDGTNIYQASTPDVTYNETRNEYMVVWRAEDNTPPVVDGEFEIYGQRISGVNGALAGSRIRVSFQGNEAETNTTTRRRSFATEGKVAWSSVDDQYLVIWYGDSDDNPPLVDGEFEVFGQWIEGDGTLTSTNFVISDMGPRGTNTFRAANPDLTYNTTDNQFLVVWYGDDDTAPLVDNENEIFGAIVNAGGGLAVPTFRISQMGDPAVTSFVGINPVVAWNADLHSYLVAWYGDNLVDNKIEIFGQSLSAAGAELGGDVVIGGSGEDEDDGFDQFNPAVAYGNGRYLVTWRGDSDAPAPLIDNETEIRGQFMLAGTIPDYRTREADNGPSHVGNGSIFLGRRLDPEPDGLAGFRADGDDLLDLDDEDGVLGTVSNRIEIVQGEALTPTIRVFNQTGTDAMLSGWVDWNNDGVFSNISERASVLIPDGADGTVQMAFGMVPTHQEESLYARFRLSTDVAAAQPTGAAADGEVEDYRLVVAPSSGLADPYVNIFTEPVTLAST
ncbi:MAG: GEVED domain-containing protein, partial [Verrucomicrobiota bacterium]